MHIWLQGICCVCTKKYSSDMMQPSWSTRATIVSDDNHNGTTIVEAIFFFCHHYIAWESNNAGEARGEYWNESLKSRYLPGGLYGLFEWYKAIHFAALSSPRPLLTMVATIVRFSPVICWIWSAISPVIFTSKIHKFLVNLITCIVDRCSCNYMNLIVYTAYIYIYQLA